MRFTTAKAGPVNMNMLFPWPLASPVPNYTTCPLIRTAISTIELRKSIRPCLETTPALTPLPLHSNAHTFTDPTVSFPRPQLTTIHLTQIPFPADPSSSSFLPLLRSILEPLSRVLLPTFVPVARRTLKIAARGQRDCVTTRGGSIVGRHD